MLYKTFAKIFSQYFDHIFIILNWHFFVHWAVLTKIFSFPYPLCPIWFASCMRGVPTFACKRQECLGQVGLFQFRHCPDNVHNNQHWNSCFKGVLAMAWCSPCWMVGTIRRKGLFFAWKSQRLPLIGKPPSHWWCRLWNLIYAIYSSLKKGVYPSKATRIPFLWECPPGASPHPKTGTPLEFVFGVTSPSKLAPNPIPVLQ